MRTPSVLTRAASALALCVLIALTGCQSGELEQKVDALTQRVQTLELENDRLKRDIEVKDKKLSDMESALAEADASLAAVQLGVNDPKDKILATIQTNHGAIILELDWKNAPKTVQNFVGLAEGTKTWTDPATGEKKRAPFYDGLTFHRVMPNFMIQGGDPKGNGTGGPGYTFADEVDGDRTFSKTGILAMANRGPNTNGSQFFITTGVPTHLNGKHTIFGDVVEGMDVVQKISSVKTGPRDKPLEDVIIETVTIERKSGS